MYYERRGRTDGAAPPVLFLHGLGSSAADWAPQLGPFGERYRLLLVDLPGHWRSALPRGRLTIAAMAERVDALLDQLDTPPAHVVGLSLGGSVGLALALRAPARVRSLTLVNAFARLAPPDAAGGLRMLARLVLLGVAPMSVVAAFVARGLFPEPQQAHLYRLAVASLGRTSRWTYLASIGALVAFHFPAVPRYWKEFLALGVFAALTTLSQGKAYTLTLSSYVEAVKQIEILFAMGVGVLFFGEAQRVRESALGGLVMLAGMVLLALAQ